ncbi:hypothetical protein [Hydrogenophaga sp. BPS33]|uniref:hypothetical protein n=1 Tax=Hydrogenophaga sp. BPS33 TaxID=2651974 RepID=UPI00131FACF5|nr:hypothetical protein [Hydrogenophaga sp. BPS33]QHE89329.1 hypothetical protein F9K07_30610 [Hydrogenophaga sp. BPS33]
MDHAAEILTTAFLGPWVRPGGNGPRMQHVYASVLHWYEAAKFMPHHPEHRDAVLFQPSLKEAKRYAKLRQSAWRTDWNLVRPSILIAGLGFLAVQRPELSLRTLDLATVNAGLAPMALPERFVEACLGRFDEWRSGPRIAFIGADAAPDQLVGKAVAKLVSALPTWTMVSTSMGRTPWRVHDWCLSHFIPIEYLGTPQSKLNPRMLADLVDRADQVVVFEERQSKKHDAVIAYARKCKKKISLELYASGTDQPRELSGLK